MYTSRSMLCRKDFVSAADIGVRANVGFVGDLTRLGRMLTKANIEWSERK